MHFWVEDDPLAYSTNKGNFKQALYFASFLLNARFCAGLVGTEFCRCDVMVCVYRV